MTIKKIKMRRMTAVGKFVMNRKNLKYNSNIIKHNYDKDSPETLLSKLIKTDHNNELNRLSNANLIYELLMKIKNFKEFVLTNDIDKEEIIKLLNEGMLKLFKLNEKIYKKGTIPQFYFLVLVGVVSFYNNTYILPGNFFGDEILKGFFYKNSAFAGEDNTFLLVIQKGLFHSTLENKLKKTNEKINLLLTNSFHIFKTFNNINLEKYKKKIIKIFPKTGQTIISNQEKANAIYIVYKGICALNNEENKDLIILDEGEIFGIESLKNIDRDMNILDGKYLYNIINKSPDTIIFKYDITDFNPLIIISLKNQLESYFSKTKKIIEKHENMKEDLENKLESNYRIFKMKKNIKDIFNKNVYKEFSPQKAEKYFYIALNKMKLEKRNINDKQKLIPKRKYLSTKRENSFTNGTKLLKKLVKSRSSLFSKRSNIYSTLTSRRKITSIPSNKKSTKEIKKIVINSNLKKSNFKEEPKNKQKKNLVIFPNKNKKNDKNKDFAISFKTLSISENSKNNSVFFTTINPKRIKRKYLYKPLSLLHAKDKIKSHQNKFLRRKIEEMKNKDDASRTIISSTFRDSISLRNKSSIINDKKTIEILGYPVLDTLDYFNYGDVEQSIFSNKQESNLRKDNIRKLLYYATKKYNMPLFIFMNNPEKLKLNLPNLSNF